jgi:hypothetical protein
MGYWPNLWSKFSLYTWFNWFHHIDALNPQYRKTINVPETVTRRLFQVKVSLLLWPWIQRCVVKIMEDSSGMTIFDFLLVIIKTINCLAWNQTHLPFSKGTYHLAPPYDTRVLLAFNCITWKYFSGDTMDSTLLCRRICCRRRIHRDFLCALYS